MDTCCISVTKLCVQGCQLAVKGIAIPIYKQLLHQLQ